MPETFIFLVLSLIFALLLNVIIPLALIWTIRSQLKSLPSTMRLPGNKKMKMIYDSKQNYATCIPLFPSREIWTRPNMSGQMQSILTDCLCRLELTASVPFWLYLLFFLQWAVGLFLILVFDHEDIVQRRVSLTLFTSILLLAIPGFCLWPRYKTYIRIRVCAKMNRKHRGVYWLCSNPGVACFSCFANIDDLQDPSIDGKREDIDPPSPVYDRMKRFGLVFE